MMNKILCCLFISLFFTPTEAFSKIGSKIVVDNKFWDFGEVREGETKEKIFILENKGDEDLLIEKVYTNCGCTTVEISSKQIVPKNKVQLKVRFNTKGKAEGSDSKDIYIISNDLANPKLKISIAAQIISAAEENLKEEKISEIPSISSEELFSHLERKEEIVILDVREENEYIERHIPDALWFPKSNFDKHDQTTEAILNKFDKAKIVVAYCGAGHRSSYVTRKLRERGYNVFNLDGVSFWEKKGYPLVRGPRLPPSLEPSLVYLEEAHEHYYKLFKDVVWLDVRNGEEYTQGHIQGALNIPLSELEDNLQRIPKDKEIVIYCEGTWDGGKCDASMSAGRILIKNGFKQEKIKVFENGYGAWENAGYPVEKGNKHD